MKKDPSVFLKHMLESIEKIEEYAKELTKEKLAKDTKLQDAVIRRIEVLGEATKNLSEEFRAKHQGVKWTEIIRTRDKIIHHYFGVDLDIVWDIAKKDLPKLKKGISEILKELESNTKNNKPKD